MIRTFLFIFLLFTSVFALNTDTSDIQTDIIPTTENTLITVGSSDGLDIVDNLFLYIKDSLFGILALLTIGVFIYIGVLLISARGNPEQFKKALMSFVYAVVGLTIVVLAWAAVRLVAGLNL